MRGLLQKIRPRRPAFRRSDDNTSPAQNRTTSVHVEVNVAKCIRNACVGVATILLAIGVLNGTVELPNAAEILAARSIENVG